MTFFSSCNFLKEMACTFAKIERSPDKKFGRNWPPGVRSFQPLTTTSFFFQVMELDNENECCIFIETTDPSECRRYNVII